ncbi:hypothetical protein Ciccas_010769, partial [Cichlidogyrus casuarinus]
MNFWEIVRPSVYYSPSVSRPAKSVLKAPKILKSAENHRPSGMLGKRDRIVFSRHVIVGDGSEMTQLNYTSDIDDIEGSQDGDDSGIGS